MLDTSTILSSSDVQERQPCGENHPAALNPATLNPADLNTAPDEARDVPAAKLCDEKRGNLDALLEKGVQFPLRSFPGPKIDVWNLISLYKLNASELGIRDQDERTALRELVEHLYQSGPERKLRCLPRTWRHLLDELQHAHPNFAEVVDYLRFRFALAETQDGVVSFDPILLAGGPGVGKSLFADKLARLFGTGFVCQRMETSQTNATLAGSDSFWSNAKPGKVFTTLMYGDYANPVFYLDEIDKISADRYDPAASLYALLEPDTAKQFADNCYPFLKLDASRVLWVATANDVQQIAAPLLSRLRVFAIPDLTGEQALSVARAIVEQLCEELGDDAKIGFEPGVFQALSQHAPRKMKQLAREAIGKAVYEGRRTCRESDIPVPAAARRKIGFF